MLEDFQLVNALLDPYPEDRHNAITLQKKIPGSDFNKYIKAVIVEQLKKIEEEDSFLSLIGQFIDKLGEQCERLSTKESINVFIKIQEAQETNNYKSLSSKLHELIKAESETPPDTEGQDSLHTAVHTPTSTSSSLTKETLGNTVACTKR